MKINIIIPSFYPAVVYGGPIFSSLHTAKELSKLDDINVLVSTTNTNMHSKLDVKTNKLIKFNKSLDVKYYNETIIDKFSFELYFNIWKDIRISDIINIQAIFNTPVPISLFYAMIFNKKVLLSPRGALCKWCIMQGNSFKKTWLNLFIKPFRKRIVWHATCQAEKEDILDIFSYAKVEIIPNGVDVKVFNKYNQLTKNDYIKKYLNIKNVQYKDIIISMSRLHAKKGFDILILSFNEVLKERKNAVLIIAGPDEGEKNNLLTMITNLNLQNNVFIIDPISGQDKVDFLANADLFVLPSHNENFGNVYIESLAAGTPIIASRGTPWKEVEEFDCGKWVSNNVKETSKATIEVLGRDRETMRRNSKNLARKYDWKTIALLFQKVFTEMVAENE